MKKEIEDVRSIIGKESVQHELGAKYFEEVFSQIKPNAKKDLLKPFVEALNSHLTTEGSSEQYE